MVDVPHLLTSAGPSMMGQVAYPTRSFFGCIVIIHFAEYVIRGGRDERGEMIVIDRTTTKIAFLPQ
jgi:hypothetical protein